MEENKIVETKKSALLYFNERDTITYKIASDYRLLAKVKGKKRGNFYRKGYLSRPSIGLVVPTYRFGEYLKFIHKVNKENHTIQYINHVSLDNFFV